MFFYREVKKTRWKSIIQLDWFDNWYKKLDDLNGKNMIQYKLIKYNNSALCKLWEEWWILSCIHEWVMYFYKQLPTKENIEKINKEIEEERRNEEEKNILHERIRKIKSDPVEWNKLESLANSYLTQEQKESSVYKALLDVRIKMIVSNYK